MADIFQPIPTGVGMWPPLVGVEPVSFVEAGILYVLLGHGALSTDDGATWTDFTTVPEGTLASSDRIGWYHDAGGCWAVYVTGGTMRIRPFDLATQVWGAVIASQSVTLPVVSTWSPVASLDPWDGHLWWPLLLLRRADASFVVAIGLNHARAGSGTWENVHIQIYDGSWHDQYFTGSSASTFSVGFPVMVAGAGGLVHIFALSIAGYSSSTYVQTYAGKWSLLHRTLSGTTLDTVQTVFTGAVAVAGDFVAARAKILELSYPLYRSDGYVYLGLSDRSDVSVSPSPTYIFYGDSVGVPTWANDQDGNRQPGPCSLAIFDGDLCVFWILPTMGLIFYHPFLDIFGHHYGQPNFAYYAHEYTRPLYGLFQPVEINGQLGFITVWNPSEGSLFYWWYQELECPPSSGGALGNVAY